VGLPPEGYRVDSAGAPRRLYHPSAAVPDVPRPVRSAPSRRSRRTGIRLPATTRHILAHPTHSASSVPICASLGDLGLHSVPFEDALTSVDLALIVTAHPGVDHELIASRAPAVLDLRGVLSGVRASHVVGL
jgi:hypothetical protein